MRLRGRKVSGVYLEVLMLLSTAYKSGTLVMMVRFGISV